MSAPQDCKDGVWSKRVTFKAWDFNESGAYTNFETDKAENDTPTITIPNCDPDTLKKGILTEVYVRLNWTNAVNLNALRIYEDAKAGDKESESHKIFDSSDYYATLTDDQEYRFLLNKAFILATEGTFFITTDWSGAPGNTPGTLRLDGETIE